MGQAGQSLLFLILREVRDREACWKTSSSSVPQAHVVSGRAYGVCVNESRKNRSFRAGLGMRMRSLSQGTDTGAKWQGSSEPCHCGWLLANLEEPRPV